MNKIIDIDGFGAVVKKINADTKNIRKILATKADKNHTHNDLASKQYVDEAIAAIPAPDLSDYAKKDEIPAQPNFTYTINIIDADQEPSVTTTGIYPDLVITFNIPQGTSSGGEENPDEPEVGTPRMWIGYMYWDETGENGFTDENEINENMPKEQIDKAIARGGMVEMDPQLLEDYDCGQCELDDEGGVYICCIYPKSCNYDVLIMTNQLSGTYKHFSDINSEDGSTGYMLCQQGTELVNKIDGITYCQSGAYMITDGSQNILAVRQL